MKKSLALIVILLFISVTVIPSTGRVVEKSTMPFDSKTLYVGGSGGGNYSKIQDAINDSSDGDTVFVYNGTYHESITINKKISIIGEDKHSSVIDACGKDFAVKITSDYVIFENFFVN